MTTRAVLTTCLAGLSLLAADASAATLSAEGGALTYRAAAGEANAVILTEDEPGEIRISDDVAIDLAAPGCRRADWDDATVVRCPARGALRVETGDRDDRITFLYDFPTGMTLVADGGAGHDQLDGPSSEAAVTLLGGDGDDKLRGGFGADTLEGSAGADELDGQNGDDTLRGGAGDDKLAGYNGNDLIDGGPGIDRITDDWLPTEAIQVGVTIDQGADDGRPGERDDVRSVEVIEIHRPAALVAGRSPVRFIVTETQEGSSRLIGGPGDDLLKSFHYADVIDGKGGDDTIEAGYGDDVITGGPGRDTINADAGAGACTFIVCRVGAGNDRVNVRDGERDSVICGPGKDTVIADKKDVIARDCERQIIRR
jgi:Ca2+-binding RTX toxin-like protein